MPGTWTHLAARFFDVALARPLQDDERAHLMTFLRQDERRLYEAQSAADQRHGFECAVEMQRLRPGRRDLARAALLHDIGKLHAGLGPIGRVVASVSAKVGFPARGRFRKYLDHGPVGAAELERLGVEALVVEFARHHHGARPHGFDPSDWQLLCEVDHARIARTRGPARYAVGDEKQA